MINSLRYYLFTKRFCLTEFLGSFLIGLGLGMDSSWSGGVGLVLLFAGLFFDHSKKRYQNLKKTFGFFV